MTDNDQDIQEVTVDGRVRLTEQVDPWTAPFWQFVEWLIGFLPTYRDTREGRSKKKQMQAVVVIGGIVLMAIGGTALEGGGFWMILGMLIACLGFVVPVEDIKKRTWKSSMAKRQQPRDKPDWRRATVECDGRYVTVTADDERIRRVRVDRGKHDVQVRRRSDGPCLGLVPLGADPDEILWICSTGSVDGDFEADETIDDDEMDRPTRVDPSDWERLWEVLRETG